MAASGSAGAAKQTSGSTTKSTSRSKNTSSKSNTTARKSPAKKKTSGRTGARSKKQQQIRRDEMKDNIIVLAMIACTIILLLSNFNLAGSIGEKIKWLMFGLNRIYFSSYNAWNSILSYIQQRIYRGCKN